MVWRMVLLLYTLHGAANGATDDEPSDATLGATQPDIGEEAVDN